MKECPNCKSWEGCHGWVEAGPDGVFLRERGCMKCGWNEQLNSPRERQHVNN